MAGVSQFGAPRALVLASAVGMLLMFGPEFVLKPLSSEPWERGLFRYAGMFLPLAAIFWTWANRYGEEPAGRLRFWMTVTLLSCLGYVALQAPLFLLLGFCFLVGSVVDLGMARAHIASDGFRSRLEEGGDWSG